MIRRKLIAGFAAVAVMTVLCGAIGYFFVDRIGKSVSIFSDVTSPLLSESLALVYDAQQMRTTFLQGIDAGEDAETVSRKLGEHHKDSRVHLGALSDLVAKSGYGLKLDTLDSAERNFLALLDTLLTSYKRERAGSLETKQRADRWTGTRKVFEANLRALVNRAEGLINQKEDEAKVSVQTGAATVDSLGNLVAGLLTQTYPIVQYGQRLLQETRQLNDSVEILLAQNDANSVDEIEQSMGSILKTMESITRLLAGRLRDDQGLAEIANIRQGIVDVRTAIVGPTGLLNSQKDVLKARAELAVGRAGLARIESLYNESLDEIVSIVRAINIGARDDATVTIAYSRWIIAGTALLALFGAVTFGIFFAGRLTRPLTKLTNHAEAIRTSGELYPIEDRAVTGRVDEFGTLSRSFNLMVADLAQARGELVAASQAELNVQYERLDAALNNMSQGLIMMDKDEKLVVCNDRYLKMYDLSPDIVKPGCTLTELCRHRVERGHLARDPGQYRKDLLARVHTGKATDTILGTVDGRKISIATQPLANGGWVSTHEDITERLAAQAKISHMALHDALTGLPNRVSFNETLMHSLEHLARDQKFAVLSLDLDRFKNVNDTLGHQFGDLLLQQAAERVRSCLREGDAFARLGGDEFVVLQNSITDLSTTNALATRLIEVISAPFDLDGHQVVIGTSIGIAVAPTDATDPDQILKSADMAMYRAKADGRGTYRFFEPEMDALMQQRRALEVDMRKALVRGEFELYYQPLVNLEKGNVVAFEALLRWNHPERGLIMPLDFIPLAEEIELIVPMGEWVLREACREAVKWPSDIRVSVNVSAVQFKPQTLPLIVAKALADSGLAPHRLELEITESIMLLDGENTLATLHQIKDLGVRIAMDDFGTGYSSLSYLRSFPFDKIKIDRSFVHNLSSDDDSMAIVRAVTGLGASLGMSTTGEGVETLEEINYLKGEGCTEAQGYYYSKAKPASQVRQMLKDREPRVSAVA